MQLSPSSLLWRGRRSKRTQRGDSASVLSARCTTPIRGPWALSIWTGLPVASPPVSSSWPRMPWGWARWLRNARLVLSGCHGCMLSGIALKKEGLSPTRLMEINVPSIMTASFSPVNLSTARLPMWRLWMSMLWTSARQCFLPSRRFQLRLWVSPATSVTPHSVHCVLGHRVCSVYLHSPVGSKSGNCWQAQGGLHQSRQQEA